MSQQRPAAPPIQYLPAFVAAVQQGSFRGAAEQLNVTPSAISQQIKRLEQRIGLSLFSRQGKELSLSQAGDEFFNVAVTSLNHYQQGWHTFSDQFLSPRIRISMTDYVANQDRIVLDATPIWQFQPVEGASIWFRSSPKGRKVIKDYPWLRVNELTGRDARGFTCYELPL